MKIVLFLLFAFIVQSCLNSINQIDYKPRDLSKNIEESISKNVFVSKMNMEIIYKKDTIKYINYCWVEHCWSKSKSGDVIIDSTGLYQLIFENNNDIIDCKGDYRFCDNEIYDSNWVACGARGGTYYYLAKFNPKDSVFLKLKNKEFGSKKLIFTQFTSDIDSSSFQKNNF